MSDLRQPADSAETGCDDKPANQTTPTSMPPQSPFRLRRLTSVMTAGTFLVVLVSGIVLMLAPAHGGGRRFSQTWGLSTHEWGAFHTGITLLFVVLCLLHVAFNAKALWCYVRDKGRAGARSALGMRREFVLGLAATAALVLLSFFRLPPLSWVVNEPPPEGQRGHGRHAAGHEGRGAEHCAHHADSEQGLSADEGRHERAERRHRRRGRRFRGGRGHGADDL